MFNGKKKEIGMKYAVKKDFYTLNSIPFLGGIHRCCKAAFFALLSAAFCAGHSSLGIWPGSLGQ